MPKIYVKQLFKNLIHFHLGIKKYTNYKPKIIINFCSNIIWASPVLTIQVPDTKILHGWEEPQKNLKI